MIQVNIRTNTDRFTATVESHETVRSVLEDNRLDYSTTQWALDGSMLVPGSLDKTFEENGVSADHCFLSAVQKQVNA